MFDAGGIKQLLKTNLLYIFTMKKFIFPKVNKIVSAIESLPRSLIVTRTYVFATDEINAGLETIIKTIPLPNNNKKERCPASTRELASLTLTRGGELN